MHTLARIFDQTSSPAEYARAYAGRLAACIDTIDQDMFTRIAETLDQVSEAGRTLYFIANGGSAATASHWVNDLVAGGYQEGASCFKAFCLTDNVASVTAIGNDSGYDNIFSYQLRTCLQAGDVVYAMSVSGNSENIIRGLDYAKQVGATTIGICGMDGGRMKARCDLVLHIPTTADEYGPVEDCFGVVEHMLATYLTMKRGKRLHH